MIRIALTLTLAVCAATAYAQVFPHLEKEDVIKRIREGKAEEETSKPDPEPEPIPEKPEVDGKVILERYFELLEEYSGSYNAQRRSMTKHTEDLHKSVRDAFEAIHIYRMGFYKEAKKLFDDIKLRTPGGDRVEGEELKKFVGHIRAGHSYYLRMQAAALQEWDDFETKEEMEEGWREALKAAKEVREEFEKLNRMNDIEGADEVLKAMANWEIVGKRQWTELWRAERSIRDKPEYIASWRRLASATASALNRLELEFTPHYLKQRAALQVMREFFKDDDWVADGWCDARLMANYVTVGQYDDWQEYAEPLDYHSEDGKKRVVNAKNVVEVAIDNMDKFKE